jgi:hypothetical protein
MAHNLGYSLWLERVKTIPTWEWLTFVSIVVGAGVLVELFRILIPLGFSRLGKKFSSKKFIQLVFPADTSKSAYATEQFYKLLHTFNRQRTFWDKFFQRKNECSLEIVSTKLNGIRYIVAANSRAIDIIKRNALSYLPGVKVTDIEDYTSTYVNSQKDKSSIEFAELKLSNHFTLPLQSQKSLNQHDPISYITGNMTELLSDELIALQVIVSPIVSGIHKDRISEINSIKYKIYRGQSLSSILKKNIFADLTLPPGISIVWLLMLGIWKIVYFAGVIIFNMFMVFIDSSGKSDLFFIAPEAIPKENLNPYEEELSAVIKSKIDQPLFETSIRLVALSSNSEKLQTRLQGLLASFGQTSSPYQSFSSKSRSLLFFDKRLRAFVKRTQSSNTIFNKNPILSTSELSDLYHFPFTNTTKTEDMSKIHSKELPAPLSIKNNSHFDVIFGKNTYGSTAVDIGFTDDDRSRHVYIIGQTGSGKSTIIYHIARDDIQKYRGLAVIDPHGDLAEDLLSCVPENRIDDCIYFNPFDIRYPIGINLLELTSGLDDDELEQEKELVCESVISIFRRVFSKDENADAHRIEYILRNVIYTAFTVPRATIFTVYELLNNPWFQKRVTKKLTDENLKNFWDNEFGRAGKFQVVKMASGVTAKVGRFLFSPTAKRILEQPKSTINFDEILSSGKILICNLAEGKLGEDTSQLLGTTIIAKIQLAAMRRVRNARSARTPFYLFIDEFQNFATSSFAKLLSGARKFGLRLTIAEQSTSQQDDRMLVNVILANTGTVICFRTASPLDEDLMLAQLAPYVEKGAIPNLPRFKFYIKLAALEPEEPFSGITLPINETKDPDLIQRVTEASRNNYATVFHRPQADQLDPEVTSTIKKPERSTGKRTFL